MSMEDLLGALSDYLLQSGFQDSSWYEMPEGEHTLDDLKRAIEQALMNGETFDENLREQIEQLQADGKLDEQVRSSNLSSACSRKITFPSTIHMTRRNALVLAVRPARSSASQVRNYRQEPRLPRL